MPLSVLPPVLLLRAMSTASLNPVATFPKASSARTFTAGLIWRFATVVPGSVPNASWVAPPAVILKLLLVAVFRIGRAAWSELLGLVVSGLGGRRLAIAFAVAT